MYVLCLFGDIFFGSLYVYFLVIDLVRWVDRRGSFIISRMVRYYKVYSLNYVSFWLWIEFWIFSFLFCSLLINRFKVIILEVRWKFLWKLKYVYMCFYGFLCLKFCNLNFVEGWRLKYFYCWFFYFLF